MEETKNLTKTSAIKGLAEKLNISHVQAKVVYETAIGMMKDTLAAGGDVRLPGIGRIYTAKLAARTYSVPGTQETITKPERTKFKIACKAQ